MTITGWIMLFVTLALLVYDIVIAILQKAKKGFNEPTITQVFRKKLNKMPGLVFACGYLAGHIWGQW